jgi:hypothetical protein
MDTFAHHTVVDSMGDYVFIDIQGKCMQYVFIDIQGKCMQYECIIMSNVSSGFVYSES